LADGRLHLHTYLCSARLNRVPQVSARFQTEHRCSGVRGVRSPSGNWLPLGRGWRVALQGLGWNKRRSHCSARPL